MNKRKILIYQIFTRLFGNSITQCKENGTLSENGCGKMTFFDDNVLNQIKNIGITHVWYTGIIRHASVTDYTAYGIPRQHPAIVKGKAGSPYAITDYYDVDPDLAEDVPHRMDEFVALVERTHANGLKAIIDFVPNHVARQYHSIAKPSEVRDFGQDDDRDKGFSPDNNFYYCVNAPFQPQFDLSCEKGAYTEFPAKATGNDCFGNNPGINDWYETVKLNYGVDYCDPGGRSYHFDPIPSTWKKMVDILLFWASKGIDGFRCDMAEMVPAAFWSWAIRIVKQKYPDIIFIAEVYNPAEYRNYISAGFDYLYDKVGMYDTMRSVICGNCPTSAITQAWQSVDDIHDNMLYFLENHDDQRVASDFFAGDGFRALPAVLVNSLMMQNPFMIYAGQEYGERGMDKEGFSGCDGRTTIFDYWTVQSLYHGYVMPEQLTDDEKHLHDIYSRILKIASTEKAVADGEFFDLMYVNPEISSRQYAFLRKCEDEVLVVVANFSGEDANIRLNIPDHAFDCLNIPHKNIKSVDLFTGEKMQMNFGVDNWLNIKLSPYDGKIYKFNINMKSDYVLNDHNKEEFPPAHTAEHLLNQTMMRLFGCERSDNAHIERKKSKISYKLDHKPSRNEEKMIVKRMNELIEADLPVTYEYVKRDELPEGIKADRLPADVSETLRLVCIGDYDVCPCIGKHVRSTLQIGRFELLGTNWDEQKRVFRIRFKVVQ